MATFSDEAVKPLRDEADRARAKLLADRLPVFAAACDDDRRGLHPLPIHPDRKVPLIEWKTYQQRQPSLGEMSRESKHLWSGFLQCVVCGGSMIVGKRTYKPTVRNWYVCSFHLKRGDTICGNGIGAPLEELDSALLDGVEAAAQTPHSLSYVLDRAAEAVRQSLAQDPEQLADLRGRRAETQRRIMRLVEAIADGTPPKSVLDQIRALEKDLTRFDTEIAGLEARAHLGHLDVARALRDLEPALAAWRDILRGNPVRARQLLRKLIVGPVVMTPMPEVHAYRWKGQLNGGAVFEGAKKYLGCRGNGPLMEQWITSPAGRPWKITLARSG